MNIFKSTAFAVLSCIILSACAGGPNAKQGVTAAAEQKGGFLGLSKAEDLKVTEATAFKGVDKVTIGSFTVGFATYKTASAKAGGGLMGNGFGGKSTAKSELLGVDDATMQAITNTAYDKFLSDLKEKGYTVVDRSALLAHKDFKGTTTMPSPYEDSSGGLFGAKSKTKYFAPTALGNIRPFLGDIPGTIGGFGFSNPLAGANVYAAESGVRVISAVYIIDFVNADTYGGSWRSSSAVTVGQGLTVAPNFSKVSFIGGQASMTSYANGSVALGQPVMSEHEFATVSDATSGASKGIEVATNVIGLLGGIGSNSSRSYTFTARPDDYRTGSLDAINKANVAFLSKTQSLR